MGILRPGSQTCRKAANLEAAQAAVAERAHRQEEAARTAVLDSLQAYRYTAQALGCLCFSGAPLRDTLVICST